MSDKYISRDNLELVIDGLKVGMTPDWNENDKSAIGYIENRPFYTDGDIVHQLDEKYIPDSIVRVEDVENAISEIDFKMDKLDPVGNGSFSLNRKSDTTIGKHSVAIGHEVTASSTYSYAEGFKTQATSSLEAETSVTTSNSYGFATHAEGYGTIARGAVSHAEGNGTIANGANSHAEGASTRAGGNYSHAEGYLCSADGPASHAEGYLAMAYGSRSHAEGGNTIAEGFGSHVEGTFTMANGSYQHVQGKYNIKDDDNTYAHIVGNGTSNTTRSNAHTLDWDGVGWFQGGLQVGGTAQDDGAKNVLLEGDAIPVPAVATVGQLLSVKAIDENGKPTEWEASDFPSGGGDVWEHLATVNMVQDASYAEVDLPYPVKKLFVMTKRQGTLAVQSGSLKIATIAQGYNNSTIAQMKYADKWRTSFSLIDFTIHPTYPYAINSDNDEHPTVKLSDLYNGTMTPSKIFITTHDAVGKFNEGVWEIYGVRA